MSSRQIGLLSGISLQRLLRAMWRGQDAKLSAAESASTLYRFFRSKHVIDLKLIFVVTAVVMIVNLLILIGCAVVFFWQPQLPDTNILDRMRVFLAPDIGKMLALCGVIFAWAYRSASKRLGVVDLFACEISTLCRVGTLFDIGQRFVDQYAATSDEKRVAITKQPADSTNFVSKEEYFPVFDNNCRDLQLLEATVVRNITEFYTYMKAMRDALRKLAEIAPPQAAEQDIAGRQAQTREEPWHAATSNVIYLLFLAYESGRKAAKDLIEFEPAAAEGAMVILLTELRCYAFLLKYFAHDALRYPRLKLREEDYEQDVPALYRDVMRHAESQKDWLPARRTAPELAKRYEDALGEDMADAMSRIERKGRRGSSASPGA